MGQNPYINWSIDRLMFEILQIRSLSRIYNEHDRPKAEAKLLLLQEALRGALANA